MSPALPVVIHVGYVLSLDPMSYMSRYPRAGFVGVPGLTLTTRRTGCGAVPEGRCPQRSGIVGGYPTARSASTSDLSACCLLRIVASPSVPQNRKAGREKRRLCLSARCADIKKATDSVGVLPLCLVARCLWNGSGVLLPETSGSLDVSYHGKGFLSRARSTDRLTFLSRISW